MVFGKYDLHIPMDSIPEKKIHTQNDAMIEVGDTLW